MKTLSDNTVLPQPQEYISKSAVDTRLSRCSCSPCCAQKHLAQKSDAFFPSESSTPFRTTVCKMQKQRKIVMFDDDVQVLTYDKRSGSVFENGKVDLIHGDAITNLEIETTTACFGKREKYMKRSTKRMLKRHGNKNIYMKEIRNKTGNTDWSMKRLVGDRIKIDYADTKRNGSWNSKRYTVKRSNNNKKGVDDGDVAVV